MVQSRGILRSAALAAATVLCLPVQGQAQGAPTGDAAFDSAYFAWQRGEYPDALRRLDRLMNGANAARYLESVAVLTGEMYHTIELTRDGRTPVWSGDGRFVAWESGAAAERRVHIAAIENGRARAVATVSGSAPRFDGQSRVIYTPAQALDTRTMRDPVSGAESPLATSGLTIQTFVNLPGSNATYVLASAPRDPAAPAPAGGGRGGPAVPTDVYLLNGNAAVKVTTAPGPKSNPVFLTGQRLLYTIDNQSFAIMSLSGLEVKTYQGSGATVSRDGGTVAYLRQDAGLNVVTVLGAAGTTDAVRRREQVTALSLSPNGSRLTYQAMPREDWDIYVVDSDGKNEKRLTRDIAHDLLPRFVDDNRIFAVTGEARHRRSYLYDIATGRKTRLFHNNTVRTVAPEYEWQLSPDATKVLIVAERDGDTVSPERGIYVLDLSRPVTLEDVRARVKSQIAHEDGLRTKGRTLFAGIDASVRAATGDVSKDRIYQYEHDLYQFDSKYITQPGNAKAIEYLTAKLREFGYDPEVQWFDTPGAAGATVRTANVIAKLPGVMQPDVLYTVSSHFDSVERGPGADDDTSGTAALLEAARVLSKRPQPTTIHFAFFTGEEAGLRGSREYVRRAVERGDKLVGALNNDMIGFANDQRLDNTIRYSNDGIRDIQHAAAFLYTDLITYDAKYYKSTDAAAYFDNYGDIVGGIGSYPILANPHYHQTHDQLETMNHQLIAEVSKTTVATLMKLTNSPSRPKKLEIVERSGAAITIKWEALADSKLLTGGGYEVIVRGANGTPKGTPLLVRTAPTALRLTNIAVGDVIEVWGTGTKGRSWDAARITVER